MKYLLTLVGLFLMCQMQAQKHQYFSQPMESFSVKKTSYITLSDGTEIEGTLKRFKRKKGLIKSIKIKVNGEAIEYLATEIKQMYLPESGVGELGRFLDAAFDATQWDNTSLNAEHLKDSYAFFEATNTQIRKKKEGVVLLQLLNPAFSSQVKVYQDPFAAETNSLSLGGIEVAGGVDKSYFVKKGDGKAERVMKKNYEDYEQMLYGDCQKMKNYLKKQKRLSWSDFPEHVFTYAQDCKE